jgi:superfamily II DNA or RNA helicase
MTELRPYQEEALQAIRASVGQGVRRLVVQAPTGSGKTLLAAAIVQGAQRKGNRMVFVVPAISLVDQTLEMFYAEGIRDVGVIQANHDMTNWSKPVQIASIQTIRSRGVYPEAKVAVFDEVHQLHKEHIKWLGHPEWANVPFIGLSATPWTKGLGKYFDSLLVMSTTKELIASGFLAPFRVFASDTPDLSNVKTVAGDYHEGQLSNVMQGSALVANIIETYKDKWNKGKTLCFGVDCAHAQMLQARFHDAGISCAYQDAKTPSKERLAIKRGFHDGAYDVICNVGTLTTGVDFDVRCLILARPTKSEMLYTQIIGRALRLGEGKDHALILDHSDTTSRLGFVTDIHHDRLSSGKFDDSEAVKRKPPLPKPCPKCACLIPVGVKICPACGFERTIVSSVTEKDGQLVEFTGAFRKKGQTSAKQHGYSLPEKARFFAQLKGYGELKGYQPGWAANKYREKFGAWPDWSIKGVNPMKPGPEVSQWIRHTFIEWAKSKRNDGKQQGFV